MHKKLVFSNEYTKDFKFCSAIRHVMQ